MRVALNCPEVRVLDDGEPARHGVAAHLDDSPAGDVRALWARSAVRRRGAPAAVDAITAWVFALNGSRSGALVGAAVVCLEARYVSVKVMGQPQLV